MIRKEKGMLYFAYGSNLNEDAMKHRCPRARKVAPLSIKDAALVFRGVADVVHREGAICHGGLWRITSVCEKELDKYEGVSSGLYMKRYLVLRVNGKKEDCLLYQMKMSRGVMPPGEHYLNTILQGYRDFGLDESTLDLALQEAWNDKEVTDHLRRRYLAKGAPRLAKNLEGDPL